MTATDDVTTALGRRSDRALPHDPGRLVMAVYLRRLRRQTGAGVRAAARSAGIVPADVRDAEAGMVTTGLGRLLSHYGVADADLVVHALHVLLSPGPVPGRWDLGAGWSERFAACQHSASAVRTYDGFTLPGWLWSDSFAAAQRRARPHGAAAPTAAVSAAGGSACTAIVPIQVFERYAAASDPIRQALPEQLRHLSALVDAGRTDVRILPAHAQHGLANPLTELRLGDHHLYAEHAGIAGVEYNMRNEDLFPFSALLDGAQAAALPPDAARDVLARLAEPDAVAQGGTHSASASWTGSPLT